MIERLRIISIIRLSPLKIYPSKFIILALTVVSTLSSYAQIPKFKSNTTDSEKVSSPIYKNFSGKYDLVIARTRQSYWWSNIQTYGLLAFKDSICLKGYYYSKRRKNGSWSKPRIKFAQVNKDSALYIVKHLTDAGFFSLNRDSLNIDRRNINKKQDQVFSVSDGTNYRFEILTTGTFTIIESYEPEYFLEKLPEFKSRALFIECRDWFAKKYKTLPSIPLGLD